MEQKIWLDYTVYKVYKNEDLHCWEAAILTPASTTPEVFRPYEETSRETVKAVKAKYPDGCVRLTEYFFQEEVEKRSLHTPEMLALLKDNYTGEDLSDWYVYASILRPMNGIDIPRESHYLPAPFGARYKQWMIHEYVVAFERLPYEITEHYDLVFISKPEGV